VRQIWSRKDFWRVTASSTNDPADKELQKAAGGYALRDVVRFSRQDTVATLVGVLLLAAAFVLELFD
jgi:hypothetical protein